jgi:hypothetical protein
VAVGLLKEGINEVIATTSYNAAPMGIHYRAGIYRMILFSGSHTASNIERDGWVIANIVHDPVIYVKAAFGDLPRESFVDEPVSGRTMQRLTDSDAWIAFTATVERKTSDAMMIQLIEEKEIVERAFIMPVNRGFNSIIDATVHGTRYCLTHDPELKKMIDYHAKITRKCGGTRELQALALLKKFIDKQ